MGLNRLDDKIKRPINTFVEQLRSKLVNNLNSVVLYGSMVSPEYRTKHSDINILIVLNKVDIEGLRHIAGLKRKYKFNRIAPLVFSQIHLENSTDTFPIEFLDMRENYVILWGEDCLKDLKIDLKNLKHQCEWELKSKLIQLQQFYINSQGADRALRNFLMKGLPSFIIIFKNILRLKNIVEEKKDKILEKVAL